MTNTENTNTAHELAIYDAAIAYASALSETTQQWNSRYSTPAERTAADAATSAAITALLETLNPETVTAITNRYSAEAGR